MGFENCYVGFGGKNELVNGISIAHNVFILESQMEFREMFSKSVFLQPKMFKKPKIHVSGAW